MDVFSRYHWLKPLESKSSRAVACALKSIYGIHGPPERPQSDNGGEFKGRTLEFCKRQKIKPIYTHVKKFEIIVFRSVKNCNVFRTTF